MQHPYSNRRASLIASTTDKSVLLSYASVCVVGVAACLNSAIKPVIIGSYVAYFALSPRTAGYLLAAEMAATGVGTVASVALLAQTRGRRFLLLALAIILAGNLGAAAMPVGHGFDPSLYLWRVMVGFGHGFALGRVGIAIAGAAHADRLAGLYTMGSAVSAAVFSFAIPELQARIGGRALFLAMAAIVAFALVGLRGFPSPVSANRSSQVPPSPPLPPLRTIFLAGTSSLIYYVGIGGYWPFAEQFAHAAHIDYTGATRILGWANLASLVGAAISVVIGDRFGRFRLLAVLFTLQVCSVVSLLLAASNIAVYAASVSLFVFSWLALFPYLLGLMSQLDPSGRLNGLLYTTALVGYSAGPAAAGWLATRSADELAGFAHVQEVELILLIIAGCMFLTLAARAHRQHHVAPPTVE